MQLDPGVVLGYPGLVVLVVGLVELLVTVAVLKGRTVTAVVGLALIVLPKLRWVGPVLLLVGAIRAPTPRSVWAGWLRDGSVLRPPGPPPRRLVVAFWLLVAGSVVGIASQGFVSVFVGIIGPHLLLMRAGRRRSRDVVAVLSAVGALVGVAVPATVMAADPGGTTGYFAVTVVVVLLVAATTAVALYMLYTDPVRDHLRAERRPVARAGGAATR